MEKKPYTAPTVTKFGNIVDETKGYAGFTWEYHGLTSFKPGGGDLKGSRTKDR